MPLYEYKCKKCLETFEIIQKVNAAPLKECLKCGGPVYKVISAPAIQFKGSGWYITDYARSGKQELKTEAPAENKKKPDKSEKTKPAENTKTTSPS